MPLTPSLPTTELQPKRHCIAYSNDDGVDRKVHIAEHAAGLIKNGAERHVDDLQGRSIGGSLFSSFFYVANGRNQNFLSRLHSALCVKKGLGRRTSKRREVVFHDLPV